MLILDPVILNLAVALGIGLLIGGERERRKGSFAFAGRNTHVYGYIASWSHELYGGR